MRPAGSSVQRPFQPLDTVEDLERVLGQVSAGPVLLFKHSLTCGASAYALEEVTDLAGRSTLPIAIIPVQTARAVSDEIERRFGVRHESPQVLLIEGGTVKWHTSHSGVTAARILDAVNTHAT